MSEDEIDLDAELGTDGDRLLDTPLYSTPGDPPLNPRAGMERPLSKDTVFDVDEGPESSLKVSPTPAGKKGHVQRFKANGSPDNSPKSLSASQSVSVAVQQSALERAVAGSAERRMHK